MRHRLYVHLVWTTRDRQPLIDVPLALFLCEYLRRCGRNEHAKVLEIGMVATHVHALIRLHPNASIPRLVQRLKGGSAAIANRDGHACRHAPLKWAKGYSIESVSLRHLDVIREYVVRQPAHHPAERIDGWDGDADRIVETRTQAQS